MEEKYNKFKFSIEKEVVYRGHRPEHVYDFIYWFDNIFSKNTKRTGIIITEDDKNIFFELKTKERHTIDKMGRYVEYLIDDFKRAFIEKRIADLQMHYLDTTTKKHKETRDYIDGFRYDKNGDERMSLFETLNKIKDSFFKYEALVPDEESEEDESKKAGEKEAEPVEPGDDDDIELDLSSKEVDIPEPEQTEYEEGLEITDFDDFYEDDLY